MRASAMMLVLALCACGTETDRAAEQPAAPAAAPAAAPQSGVAGKPAAAKPAMIEVPADRQQLERLLALGYTVHDTHLHPPGVKECPFDMGGGVVQ